MKLVSPILFYNIYNDCMNNDTNYRLLVCVCIVLTFVSRVLKNDIKVLKIVAK